jgi:PAS domain S-box-containing protein
MDHILRILHLEDLPTDAELIERELKKGGLTFKKLVVDKKEEYLKGLENFKPDIVLSDHSLPTFDSYEALNILKRLNINIPFILVTATISEEFAVTIIKQGAEDYILKDRLQRLPTAVQNAIEKKRLEKEKQKFIEEVIENEALLQEAEQMAHFGSFKVDNVNNIVKWSKECYNIFGYKPHETEPTFNNFIQCIHPDDREYVKQKVYGAENAQNGLKINYRIKAGDEIKYVHSELAVERNQDGWPVFIKGFVQNITEIKTAEDELHRSEANLETIFDNTDNAYILFSPGQKIISFNKQAAFFTKELFKKDLRAGLYSSDYFSDKRQPHIAAAFTRALDGESVSYETSFFNSAGEVKWYASRWLGVSGDKELNLGVILAISDITERKIAELEREKIAQDLVQRNNALEQFAFIVSHNLRAPVANIISLADTLYTWNQPPEGKEVFLDALSVSAKKLDEVVLDLNHILRITQRVNEQKQIVYFQQLVDEIKAALGDRIIRESIVIRTDFTKMMNTYALKSFLFNIFYNLIINSINFKQPFIPPVINISSRQENATFTLVFKDNGRGIDLKKHGKHIFGLYKRFDTSVEGRGLGLCMTKTQVETLGGAIRVESELNKGTTFIIELPV